MKKCVGLLHVVVLASLVVYVKHHSYTHSECQQQQTFSNTWADWGGGLWGKELSPCGLIMGCLSPAAAADAQPIACRPVLSPAAGNMSEDAAPFSCFDSPAQTCHARRGQLDLAWMPKCLKNACCHSFCGIPAELIHAAFSGHLLPTAT